MVKIVKVFAGILGWLLGIVMILMAVGLFLTKQNNRWGVRVFHIETGSMSPTMPVGTLLIEKSQDKYGVGDVITFQIESKQNVFVTHRVVKIEEDNEIGKLKYQTKGDANQSEDPELVDKSQVVGRVIWYAPYLGMPMGYVKTQNGFIFLIVVPATILIYSELVNIKNEVVKLWQNRKRKP